MIATRLEKHALLVTINSLAALSIFFFGRENFAVHSWFCCNQRLTSRTGYDQGMMGGVNESPDYVETMEIGRSDNGTLIITNSLLQGGIVAIFYLGTLIGCLIGGAFGDKYGRIRTIGLGSSISILGACLQCAAQNSTWMLVARVINGIGTGALNTIVPAWASEVAEHTSRGKFIAIEFTLNIFGVVVAYWLGYGVKVSDGQSAFQWRFPIAFQIIPLLLLFSACWFFPESPRWLCRVDRDDEALFILQRLRGVSGLDEGRAEAELMDIKRIVELETTDNNSYIHMLFGIKSGRLHTGRRVQLCIWLQIMQNWVGISAVTIYGPSK